MMDQNRCLLDVIGDPQLLQSFLESEPSADHNRQATTSRENRPTTDLNSTPTANANPSSNPVLNSIITTNINNNNIITNNNVGSDFGARNDSNNAIESSDFIKRTENSQLVATNNCTSVTNSNVQPSLQYGSNYGQTPYDVPLTDEDLGISIVDSIVEDISSYDQREESLKETESLNPIQTSVTPTDVSSQNYENHAPKEEVKSELTVQVGPNSSNTNDVFQYHNTDLQSSRAQDQYFPFDKNSMIKNEQENVSQYPSTNSFVPQNELDLPSTKTVGAEENASITDEQVESISDNYTISKSNDIAPVVFMKSSAKENSPLHDQTSNVSDSLIDVKEEEACASVTQTENNSQPIGPLLNPTPQVQTIPDNLPVTNNATTITPTPTTSTITTPINTTTTTTTTTTTSKNVTSAPKRAPKKSTPRTTKGKNNKSSTLTTNNQTTSQTTVQPQFTTPSQQQILFQTTNNGIRQPAILAPSTLGSPLGGMGQQQRVIQIQTANGPMYFAIAPGPALNSSPMMNQGVQSQQYPSQQLCFQPNSTVMINRSQLNQTTTQQLPSQPIRPDFMQSNNSTSTTQTTQQPDRSNQFTSNLQPPGCITNSQGVVTGSTQQPQQIRLQSPNLQFGSQNNQLITSSPNQVSTVNGVSINDNQQKFGSPQAGGPVILQNRTIQSFVPSQQVVSSQSSNMIVNSQQILQSPQQQQQPRIGAPIVAGQTLAISNPSNPQQQNIVLPSSQPMVMPRMTNQLILNRAINNTGQMMPGQQQFIQIQTPNGPMLLALPPPQTQPMNNTMIDYNSQVQKSHQQPEHSSKVQENFQSSPTKQSSTNSPTKSCNSSSGSKPGLDLADLLLDCGILPEERMSASQSPGSIKTSQSPSLSQMSSPMPQIPQLSSSISPVDSSLSNASNQQQQQQPIQQNFTAPMQQQPIRITIGPDGQMIMQHTLYGAIRPMMANTLGQPHLIPANSTTTTNMIPSTSPIMTSTNSNPTNTTNDDANNETKKTTTKGKGSATKRSRSKKSDLDKFPILKTPKIAQQQQQQQQQHMQSVTVVPMTVLVDQNKGVLGVSDGKSNVGQLAGGQQVSLAKIVTAPTMIRTTPLVQGNMMQQTSISQQNNITNTSMRQSSDLMIQNPQLMSVDSANSISTSNSSHQNSTPENLASISQQLTSSGNVTTNSFIQKTDNSGTVESNPHISSSMMSTISLPTDSSKIEQNGFKPSEGQQHTIKAVNNGGGGITTLIIHQPHHQQNQSTQLQQVARQIDLRAQSILNQLGADQNAALNPQTKQSFKSFEDACKRLLRYHVFDTQIVSEEQIKKVDEIFEMATESLISRKQAIYDKYRLLILKQSMKTVPPCEEVMMDQIFISDEQTYLKRERELFKEYEAQLERISSREADSKPDSRDDYFGFGDNSPKQNNRDDLEGSNNSREVDEWLLTDKWGKSRYPSVPDSEAATAIESILNEELS